MRVRYYNPDIRRFINQDVKVGDSIRTSEGENLPIDKAEIEELEEPVLVYNFEVADFHTYYVSDFGMLVHNMCMVKKSGKDTTRVRHYTNFKGVKGIQDSGVIYAQDNNRVYMELANKKPLSSIDAESIY